MSLKGTLAAFALAFLLVFPQASALASDLIKVAIVDSGMDLTDPRFTSVLCPAEDHHDFTGEGMEDRLGHGTHVVGIVRKEAGDSGYCLMIEKYYDDETTGGPATIAREVKAIRWAISHGASIINISGGGAGFNEEEYLTIRENPSVLFIVAAGNERCDLDVVGNYYYPASYGLPNIVAVGALKQDGARASYSNWGKKVVWERGDRVLSTLPNGRIGYMSGSSQATGARTGKTIASRLGVRARVR